MAEISVCQLELSPFAPVVMVKIDDSLIATVFFFNTYTSSSIGPLGFGSEPSGNRAEAGRNGAVPLKYRSIHMSLNWQLAATSL